MSYSKKVVLNSSRPLCSNKWNVEAATFCPTQILDKGVYYKVSQKNVFYLVISYYV